MSLAGLLAVLRQRPELAWLLIADLGLSAGLVSLGLSLIGGYAACYLCVAQRALLLAMAPTALVAGLRFGHRGGAVAALVALLLAAAGLAVAVFQSLVERRTDLACDAPIAPGWLEAAVQWLEGLSPFLFGVNGTCSATLVSLGGVSLANLGAAAFAAMLAAGVWATVEARRGARTRP